MLTENGRVLAVEKDAVWVETLKTSTCAQCQARHGCGQKLLAASDAYTRVHLALPAEFANLQPGDQVVIGIEEGAFVGSVLLVYGLPLASMLSAVGALSMLGVSNELYLVLAALFGLLAGGLIVRLAAQTLANDHCGKARLIDRLSANSAVNQDPIKFS